jgi:hypothetical protein
MSNNQSKNPTQTRSKHEETRPPTKTGSDDWEGYPFPKTQNKIISLIRWPACKRTRKGNAMSNPNKALMTTGFYIHQLPFNSEPKILKEREYKIKSNPRYFRSTVHNFS